MISTTIPGTVTLGCSRIRVVSRFSSAIFADLSTRGFPISCATLARVALIRSFLALVTRPPLHRNANDAVSFRTIANYAAASR